MPLTRAGALVAAGLAAFAVAAAQTPPAADLVLLNAKVFTADPARPWEEAVAIRGDRIVDVGTTAALRRYADRARVVDLAGRVVVPGLNDAHTHVGARPPGASIQISGSDPTLDEVLAAVRKTAAETPAPQWIYGTIAERVLSDPKANRNALDAAAPGRIVKLSAWTGHGQILSTAAMRALAVGDREPDPPFGRYGRLATGEVSGLLEEYADVRANRRMAAAAGVDAIVASLRRLAVEAVGYGITTIQAMANSVPAGELVTLLPAADTPIRWRIIRFPIATAERDAPADLGALPAHPTPLITVSGTKWILDGTPIERLAAMQEPYADRPGWTGRLNLPAADLEAALRRAIDVGDQPLFHVVGDRGLDTLLSAMERLAPPARWQALRPRIEHGEFLNGARIERARRLGVVLVQNPAHFTIAAEMRQRYGATRAAATEAVRSVLAAGVPLAIGADGPLNPFLNMMFAIQNPANPGQALTREQVIAAYATGSAFAEFAEREKGRLAPGLLADVAVLTQDIFTVPADRLPATQAAMTIVGGRVVRDTITRNEAR
jgi:predicted amidohydrolase YtcJ